MKSFTEERKVKNRRKKKDSEKKHLRKRKQVVKVLRRIPTEEGLVTIYEVTSRKVKKKRKAVRSFFKLKEVRKLHSKMRPWKDEDELSRFLAQCEASEMIPEDAIPELPEIASGKAENPEEE